jgi:hypothetical protein
VESRTIKFRSCPVEWAPSLDERLPTGLIAASGRLPCITGHPALFTTFKRLSR